MSDYWKPSVATDLVAFGVDTEGHIRVLLIERGAEPFLGKRAFPGGFLQEDDPDLESCACREGSEETGFTIEPYMIDQLTVRSEKDRDPRQNRVISVSFLYIHAGDLPPVKGADDARRAEWIRIQDLQPDELAFDHGIIYEKAIRQIINMNADQAIPLHPINVKEQLQLGGIDETFRRNVGALR